MNKIRLDSPDAIDRAIKRINSVNLDGGMELLIQKYRPDRSLAQNRLYWKWIAAIANDTGNDPDALHDHFRSKFLGARMIDVLGQRRAVLPTTTKLSVKDFTVYLERIEAFASTELGIVLPHPDDCYHEAMIGRCRA